MDVKCSGVTDNSDDFCTRLMTAWLVLGHAVQHHDMNTKLTKSKESKSSKAREVNQRKKGLEDYTRNRPRPPPSLPSNKKMSLASFTGS